jgi:hypothetical protein
MAGVLAIDFLLFFVLDVLNSRVCFSSLDLSLNGNLNVIMDSYM